MSRESAVDKSAYGNNKLAQWGVADDQLTSVQQWLASMMLLGVVSVHQYMMVSPVLTFIGDEYGMTLGNVGFMMSVFNIAGLILVYPAAALLRKFGVKFSLILTVVVSLLGNIMSLAATGVEMFLVARTLQGCGFGLIGVVGNNLIPRLMPASKIGLSMGIWGQWFPGGVFLATFTTPALYAAFGWRSLFVMSSILFVITAVLLLVWFKLPRVPENVVVQGKKNAVRKFTKTHFKSAMLIIVAFLSWGIVYNAINSFYPTYAQDVYNRSRTGRLPIHLTSGCFPSMPRWSRSSRKPLCALRMPARMSRRSISSSLIRHSNMLRHGAVLSRFRACRVSSS